MKYLKKQQKIKKNIKNALKLINKNAKEIVNVNTNEKVNITAKTINESIAKISINDVNYQDYCNCICNIAELFKTSEKILSYNDTKNISKTKYSRYANIAKTNNNEYLLEFVVRDINNLEIYSMIPIENGTAKRVANNTSHHDTANNSIAYIQNLFKSKLIKKYNNDYKSEIKKNKSKIYFQGESDFSNRPKTLEEIHEQVRANAKGTEYLGYFTEFKKKNIIGIMENADASTVVHELGHSFLNALQDMSKTDPEIDRKYQAVKNWLGVVGNNITIEQHEKFAQGFEAYLYNGKAPNRTLQSVFAQFKEWLRDIKDYWLKNNDDFVMNDEVKKVFDTIFEEKPKETKSQKRIKKYVETAKNISISDNGLNDSQKRHKDIAYDIVARATGYNKKYLRMVLNSNDKMQKQYEEVFRRCNECDDKISADGFNPEWTEFYGNKDFYLDGNDYMLAEAALSDIVNESWKNTFTQADYFNEYQAQYEYLIGLYKSEVLERDEIFAAVWDWTDGLEDKEASELYGEKFIRDVEYIDRFEKLSEIEQAKEKILQAAKDLEYGNATARENARNTISKAVNNLQYKTTDVKNNVTQNIIDKTAELENISEPVKQYRETLKTILNNLDFLTPSDKAKMFANIIDAPSANFLKAKIDSVMDIADTMNEIQYRKNLLNDIKKELQATKDVKQDNRKVGKYDYRTNKLFQQIRDIQKLSAEQANDLRIERQQLFEDAENNGMTFEDRILNGFIQIKADGIRF